MATSAANNPSEIEAQFQGETRTADGYQYWTTSQEDEDAQDVREKVAQGQDPEKEKKKPRKPLFTPGTLRKFGFRLASLLLLAIVAGGGYFIFNLVQVYGANETDDLIPFETVSATDPELRPVTADAIVVLGAAQNNGEPSFTLKERLDHAYFLWKDGVAPVIMTTGGNQEGDITTEGRAGFVYLAGRGVPEEDIWVIPEGTNTYSQLSAAQFQLVSNELNSVILVSDGYHSYRLQQIAGELEMQNVLLSPATTLDQPTIGNHVREAAAVSIGRITGYRRLSAFTEDG